MLPDLKKIKNHALNLRDFFIDLIFPIECLGCKKETHWLCPECFNLLKFNTESRCPACNRKTHCGQYCVYCEDDYFLNGIFVAGNYKQNIIKSLIKNLKYNLIKDIAPLLGNFLSDYYKEQTKENIQREKIFQINSKIIINYDKPKNLFNKPNDILIIPIPLHAKRLRWRGFNQSEIIAEKFARNLNLGFEKNNLIRVKYKKAQAKLNKINRIKNIKDCFFWQGGIINKNIILIDDVASTGSTLNEAAKILKANGAYDVWGLVVAKN